MPIAADTAPSRQAMLTPVVPPSGIIPAGAPGAGTATVGTESMPFARQVWEPADWERWLAERERYDATVRAVQARNEAALEEQRMLDRIFDQNARMQNAEDAMTSALRFQGVRGFERDIEAARASGLSDEQAMIQALTRNAPRMFYGGSPAWAGQLARAARPAAEMPELGAVEVPGLPGYKAVQVGPQSRQLVAPPRPVSQELTPSQRASILKSQIDSLTEAILFTTGDEKKRLVEERATALREYHRMLGPSTAPADLRPEARAAPSGGVIRVRRKSDGRVLPYRGRREDVLDDPDYELVE